MFVKGTSGVDRWLEAKKALIKTTMTMRSELNVVMTTSNNLQMLLVTNISVAISSGLSVKKAVLACKNFTDNGVHVELHNVQKVVMSICPSAQIKSRTSTDTWIKIIYEK